MIDADGAVVHEVGVALPPDEVFEFFIDPEQLLRWIGLSDATAGRAPAAYPPPGAS